MTMLAPAGEQSVPVDRGRSLLVGSSGGHLAQLLPLAPLWEPARRKWITFRTPDAESALVGEDVVWAHHPTTRNVRNLVRNAALAWKVLRRERPDVVISTGAAVAFPFFLIARLLGTPTVYVEVFDRIDSATLTGRLCYPLSSLFLVQWEEQRSFYPKAISVGHLL